MDHADFDEREIFGTSVRKFLEFAVVPNMEKWRDAQCVPREAWRQAGAAGLLGASVAEKYGGSGGTFRHEMTIMREFGRIGFPDFGIPLHNAIVAPYLEKYCSEAQKLSWLPKFTSGEMIGAIAMTEPGTGSDLQRMTTRAERKGDRYVISGQKTFITNGQNANLIIVAAKTDLKAGGKGISLFAIDAEKANGLRRGRNLKKVGMHAQDTSELFFDDVEVPLDGLIGGIEGRGFAQLRDNLPQERLVIAVQALAAIETAVELTVAYVKERTAFGQPIAAFQNTRFELAEMKTEAAVGAAFVEQCAQKLLRGELDDTTAAMAKWWLADKQCSVADRCLQLFGGYGYMAEYPISRIWTDSRVQKIYGGTNEIMKELIARSL